MLNINKKEIQQYIKNLKNVSKTAFPKTIRSTLDRMAFLAQKQYKKNVRKNFTIRNAKSNIILKSIRYEKCSKSLNINKMVSKTGQAEQTFGKITNQLRKQEFGEYMHSTRKHIMKPTKAARGGSYKRAVKPENFMSKIKVSRIEDLVKNPARNEFRQFRQAVGFAKKNPNKKIYYLPSEESYFGINGIAELDGSRNGNIVKFLYSIKGKTQKLNRVPTLEPVGNDIGKQGQEIFVHEAQRRIMKELSKKLNS